MKCVMQISFRNTYFFPGSAFVTGAPMDDMVPEDDPDNVPHWFLWEFRDWNPFILLWSHEYSASVSISSSIDIHY